MLEPWVAQSVFAPLQFLLVCLCTNVGPWGLLVVTLPAPFVPQSASLWIRPHCLEACPPRLPISAPPTGLDKCFFFISLVVGLLCGSIFCQFWLFFVFKLLLSFWLCEEVQCVYLHLHVGRNCYIVKSYEAKYNEEDKPIIVLEKK